MPERRNLPTVFIDGTRALASRPEPDRAEQLRRSIDKGIQVKLAAQDEEFLQSLGVTRNGVVGGAHRGLMCMLIKSWGIENGERPLIDASFEEIVVQFPFARNRTPGLRMKNLIAQAVEQLRLTQVDDQAGG